MKRIKLVVTAFLFMAVSVMLKAQHKPSYEKEGEKIRVTHYYDNGNVRETGTYVNGKPDGKWIQYDRNGVISYEANYRAGEKDGKWFKWTDEGSVLYEMVYNDNSLVDVQKWKIEERNMLAGN